MSDRTTVYITFPGWAEPFCGNVNVAEWGDNNDGTVQAIEYGCDYAESTLEDQLRLHGVGYDKAWNAGDDYPAGRCWVRFGADGELEAREINDDMKVELADALIDLYLNRLGQDPTAVNQTGLLMDLGAKACEAFTRYHLQPAPVDVAAIEPTERQRQVLTDFIKED